MRNKFIIIVSYLLIFFNSNLLSNENNNALKIGLLAPLSGEYKELGNSLLYSLQLALNEIDDKNVYIIPQDSGSNDKKKLNDAVRELRSKNINIVIGPINNEDFEEVKKFNDIIFISPSNIDPEFQQNVISIGISFESQMIALVKFIKQQKKNKPIIFIPKNNYTSLIEKKLDKLNLNEYKIFKYNPDPKILTGEIEILTNYSQRKKNLKLRKKIFEDKDDEQSKRQLARLEQKYTLGDVNFDSVIIIDFGSSLKSVLTSLIFTDVDQKKVLFTTVNQWFDESIFYENTVKNLYYPSVNYKEFKKYKDKYFKTFNNYPSEITILAYDALGLIYYVWKKNGKINSVNDFSFKGKVKGKIGTFSFNNKKIIQDLNIYKAENNQFKKF
ncbi:ABC transporter substrate-binding protein [Pelagibacterales bacterium SAG-MED05]|nr:ABC transporter substrate-binding protein [Pelagibacterales bacterium SAG-MED05]